MTGLLKALEGAHEGSGRVSIEAVRAHLGLRSFGPCLLFAGLFGSTPASGVPTVPTLIGVIVLLTAGQLVLGLRQVWLPRALLKRSISRERFEKALRLLRRPAGALDRLVHPRLTFLTEGPMARVVGLCCCLIAFVKPPLEFVPLTSAIPAMVIAIFGLALTAHDGLVAIVGFAAFAALVGSIWFLGGGLLL